MSPNPLPTWLRLPQLLLLLLLLLLLISVGCGGNESPTAVPTATPTVVVAGRSNVAPAKARPATATVPLPTQVPQRTPQVGPTTLATFALPFPPDWRYILLAPTGRAAEFAPLYAALNEHQDLMATVLMDDAETAQIAATEPWLVAWPPTAPEGVGLVAYVLPRNGLTMPSYMRLLQESLATQEGLVVQQATINHTLHPNDPVGLLHYTLPSQPSPSSGGQLTSTNGYQLIYFDQTATNMLLVTYIDRRPLSLTAQSAADHTLPPQLERLAQMITTVPATEENEGYALRKFTD